MYVSMYVDANFIYFIFSEMLYQNLKKKDSVSAKLLSGRFRFDSNLEQEFWEIAIRELAPEVYEKYYNYISLKW